MPDQTYTRCPGCMTIFRVTPEQLAMRAGLVRCGHCKNVFDGNAAMISLAPQKEPDSAARDEAMRGPPTVTLRDAAALTPAAGDAGTDDAREPAVPADPEPAAVEPELATVESEPAATLDTPDDDALAWENRFAPKRGGRHPGLLDKAYTFALPLLLLLLIAQAVFHFRDFLSAHLPPAKPVLAKACAVLGCTINPLRDTDNGGALSIDASDLQADPAHRGLLVLTATLRNRATWPLAYPYLELTLTDAQDQVVVRRALAPSDYAGGTVDVAAGITANSEVAVKLFIDASATTQAGYRLYAFYP